MAKSVGAHLNIQGLIENIFDSLLHENKYHDFRPQYCGEKFTLRLGLQDLCLVRVVLLGDSLTVTYRICREPNLTTIRDHTPPPCMVPDFESIVMCSGKSSENIHGRLPESLSIYSQYRCITIILVSRIPLSRNRWQQWN